MNKRRSSVAGMLIFIVFVVYFCHIIVDQQKIINEKELALKAIEKKISGEENLKKQLEKEKEMLDSEEYIEKIARKKLGMVKPGERIFIDINK
ncbi:MAG: septum formation initiator family protein [Clostridiaceae bacterium]|jgi:cell division protein FtsL|nr:septum formation initiator family protein [Clostridiaceae bacterium]